jgi:zinc transport system substrate-binding protein
MPEICAHHMLMASHQLSSGNNPQPYWSYHDAYQYLERSLNLKFAGALTDDLHIAPTIAQIKYPQDSRPQAKNACWRKGRPVKTSIKNLIPSFFSMWMKA